MKTVTLYEKCSNGKVFFSLDDVCLDYFTEVIGKKEYVIPEGFEIAKDMTGTKHFYRIDSTNDFGVLQTDHTKNGDFPYLAGCRFNGGKRIYLHRPSSHA